MMLLESLPDSMQPVIFSDLEHRFESPKGHIAHSSALWYSSYHKKVFLVWYQGRHERSTDCKLMLSEWDLKSSWSKPRSIHNSFSKSDANAVIWDDNQGHLHLMFCTLYGKDWTDAKLFYKKSTDGGLSFEPERELHGLDGHLVRNKPLCLNEKVLIPIYHEASWSSMMLSSNSPTGKFVKGDKVYSTDDLIQPAICKTATGRMVCYFRSSHHHKDLYMSFSDDDGKSWMPARKSKLPNNNSSVDVCNAGDKVILAFNDSSSVRTPLSLGLSHDGGMNFREIRHLETDHGEFSYPSILCLPDGKLLISYTHQKDTIQIKVVLPDWISRRPDRIQE